MIERLVRWFWRWLFGGRYQFPRKSQKGKLAEDLFSPEFGWTYEICEIDGPLLYIGKAKHFPYGRLAEHVRKDWFPDNAHVIVRRWSNLHNAGLAEQHAIRTLNPRANKVRYTNGVDSAYPPPIATYRLTHEKVM